MTACPHCGAAIAPTAKICPYCGVILAGVWPPPPEGFVPPNTPQKPKTLTGQIWTDFGVGFLTQYLVHLATARVLVRYVPTISQSRDWMKKAGVPGGFVLTEMFWAIVLGGLLYYGIRPFYAMVARGAGYSLLLLLAVLLGAFFTCHPLLY